MTRWEYCRKTSIKRWKLIKCISMLSNGYSVKEIQKVLNLKTKSILTIEVLFVKKRQEVFTKLGCKNMPYYGSEQEMIIEKYNGSDLTGWELEVFNSKN